MNKYKEERSSNTNETAEMKIIEETLYHLENSFKYKVMEWAKIDKYPYYEITKYRKVLRTGLVFFENKYYLNIRSAIHSVESFETISIWWE